MIRTQDEIVARYREARGEDFLGFRGEVLLSYLDADRFREFAKDGADLSDFPVAALDEDSIREEVRSYMEFAWGKVEGHRGISASRSVDKISEWLWVLGMDKLRDQMLDAEYAQYGAPQLLVACEGLGLPVPETTAVQRMTRGLQCRAEDDPWAPCQDGCSS